MTAVLTAPTRSAADRPPSTREDAVRWIEWQERNYAEHDFGLWVVETHAASSSGTAGSRCRTSRARPTSRSATT